MFLSKKTIYFIVFILTLQPISRFISLQYTPVLAPILSIISIFLGTLLLLALYQNIEQPPPTYHPAIPSLTFIGFLFLAWGAFQHLQQHHWLLGTALIALSAFTGIMTLLFQIAIRKKIRLHRSPRTSRTFVL